MRPKVRRQTGGGRPLAAALLAWRRKDRVARSSRRHYAGAGMRRSDDHLPEGLAAHAEAMGAARRGDLTRLVALVRAGLESGAAVELTDEDWERKRAELVRRHSAQGA